MMDAMTGEFIGDEEQPRTLDIEIDVTFQKKRFVTLHLEEPTGKQLERAELELNQVNQTPYTIRRYQIMLIAQVAQVPREVVLELKESEIMRAFNFLEDQRRSASQATGET
jgi:hypothetical protein